MSTRSELFCLMLESKTVEAIVWNVDTALLLYTTTGQVFSPNQWERIAKIEERRLLDEHHKSQGTIPKDKSPSTSNKVQSKRDNDVPEVSS